jgi:hypothetical protein
MYPHGVFRARFNGKPIQDRVIACRDELLLPVHDFFRGAVHRCCN